jgi:hypothetical protein
VDGGPSRESLDVVYDLLRDQLSATIALEKDELDEEISNHLQSRHQFMVEIVLNIVLLEEELNALELQITGFVNKSMSMSSEKKVDGEASGAGDAEVKGDIEGEAEPTARDESGADKAVKLTAGGEDATQDNEEPAKPRKTSRVGISSSKADAETLASLLLQHETSAQELEQRLLEKKQELEKKWRERLNRARSKRILELEESGMSHDDAVAAANKEFSSGQDGVASVAGAGTGAGTGGDADGPKAGGAWEGQEEAAAELRALEQERQQALQKLHAEALADIRKRGDEMAAALDDQLLSQRDSAKRKLAERLGNQRAKLFADNNIDMSAMEGHTDGEKEEKALAELPPAALDEYLKLKTQLEGDFDQQDRREDEEARTRRAAVLAFIKDQHDKEASRLQEEQEYLRNKRSKELQARLDRKKAEKVQQMLTAHPNLEAGTAVLLVEAESADDSAEEQATIDRECASSIANVDKEMSESLRQLHEKESQRLEQEYAYQEQRQKDKLNKALKERELRKKQKQEQEDLQQQMSQKQKEQQEQAAQAEKEDQAKQLQDALTQLRNEHDKQMEKLSDDLLTKKSQANKALEQRLQQQKEKVAKQQQEKQEQKLKGISLEEYITNSKHTQKRLQHRLSMLIQGSKKNISQLKSTFMIVNAKEGVNIAKGASGSKGDPVAAAQGLLIYSLVNEHLAIGFKKRCLYELTCLKKVQQGPDGLLSAADVSDLQSPQFMLRSNNDACDKLITRFGRDLKSMFESLESELQTTSSSLRESAYSEAKIRENVRQLYSNAFSSAMEEFRSLLLTVSGVWWDRKLLGTFLFDGENVASAKSVRLERLVEEPGAEVADDEEDEDHSPSRNTGNAGGGPTNAFVASFGKHFLGHIEDVLGIIAQYMTSAWNIVNVLLATNSKVCCLIEKVEVAEYICSVGHGGIGDGPRAQYHTQ